MARNAKPVAPIAPVASALTVEALQAEMNAKFDALMAAVSKPGAPVAVEPVPVAPAIGPSKTAKVPKAAPVAAVATDTPFAAKNGGGVVVKRRTTKKGKGYAVVAFHSGWGGSAILTRAQWVALCNAIRGDRQFCQNVATLLD